MSTPFDPELWRQAQQALDQLIELPEDQRPAALAALQLAAPVRAKLALMLDSLDQPGLLDSPPPGLPAANRESADGSAGRSIPGQGGCPASVGGWRLIEEIGRGGMAVVYCAERELAGTTQRAALKLMSTGALAADGRRRFEQEQAVLARLGHPAITPLIDAGQLADGTPWLAMPLIQGQRIDHWCRDRALSARDIVRLVMEVCAAVSHAHRQLVLHRDIKPGNIMVDHDGHIHLLDFGIARLLDEVDSEDTGTRWRAFTPQYAAPERLLGGDSGLAMDVFSLGALLYQLLTGRTPRELTDPPDSRITRPSLAAHERADIESGERQRLERLLRGDLDRILLKALAPEPEDRYDNVALLAEDLQAWLDCRPVRAARANRIYRAGKFVRRHRGGVAASLLVLLAILGGLVGTIWQAHRAEQAAALARLQAERALSAEADARRAQLRAESLNDFLLGLFRASRPLRPGDDMPSPDELLAAGAERAQRDIEADASLRADMLSAIAAIYLQRQMAEAADPLIDQALSLSETLAAEEPAAWVRARLTAAQQAMTVRDFTRAANLLDVIDDGAEALPADHVLRLESRYERARLDLVEQRPEQARDQLEALHAELAGRSDLSRDLRLRVANLLGWSLASAGQYAEADAVYAELITAAALEYGPSHLNYAVHLANAGGNAMRMGAFARADKWLTDAIGIYDRLGDDPLPQRATARSLLGMLRLAQGQHVEASAANRASRSEWAALMGLDRVEDDPVFQYREAMIELDQAEFSRAAERLGQALALNWPPGMSSRLARVDVLILLAESQCQLGQRAAAEDTFRSIAEERAELDYTDPRWLAWLAHARAVCAEQAGDRPAALAAMDEAEQHSAQLSAGFIHELARRAVYQVELLLADGQPDRAGILANRTLAALAAVHLEHHPTASQLAQQAVRSGQDR